MTVFGIFQASLGECGAAQSGIGNCIAFIFQPFAQHGNLGGSPHTIVAFKHNQFAGEVLNDAIGKANAVIDGFGHDSPPWVAICLSALRRERRGGRLGLGMPS